MGCGVWGVERGYGMWGGVGCGVVCGVWDMRWYSCRLCSFIVTIENLWNLVKRRAQVFMELPFSNGSSMKTCAQGTLKI